ncbi:MAG: AsmA-like C-terminal region-containing protein [Rhodospirillaceae bacterium]
MTDTEPHIPPAESAAKPASNAGAERGRVARFCRGLLHLSAGVIAGVTIVGMVLAWHLSRGPISLSFLTSYIQSALNERTPDLNVTMSDTILTWAGWERALDIRVIDVLAMDKNGVMVAAIPEISFSLSATALIRDGEIVPKAVELFGPSLTLVRRLDGGFQLDLGHDASGQNFGSGLFGLLFNKPKPGSAVASLVRLNVIGAEAVIEDRILGRTWNAPTADIRLTRDATGIKGEVGLQVARDGKVSEVTAKGSYLTEDRRLNLSINFDAIDPDTLADVRPEFYRFAGIRVPLKGTVTLGMSVDGLPDEVGFRLTGGEGTVTLPVAGSEIIPVEHLVVNGYFDGRARVAEVYDFEFKAKPNTTILSPRSASHRIPIAGARFTGKYLIDRDRFEISRLEVDTGGPVATLTGVIEDVSGASQANFNIGVKDVPLKDVPAYWAPEWAADVYNWWVPNVTDGHVPRIAVKVSAAQSGGDWRVVSVAGDMDVRGAKISYLDGLPPVTEIDGRANFTHKRFDAFVTSARSGGMIIQGGEVFITDIDHIDQFAEINVNLTGGLDKAMQLIDRKPLGYAKLMGINPKSVKGDARVRLKIDLPLMRKLALDHVKISAEARLRDAKVPRVLRGFDVTDADLNLTVDKGGLDVRGSGYVAGVPAKLSWRENFSMTAPVTTILDLSGRIPDIQTVSKLGIELGPLDDGYVKGPVGADLRVTVLRDRNTRVEVRADLGQAAVDLTQIKWFKPAGEAGRAEMNLVVQAEKIRKVEHFALYAEDLAITGKADFETDGQSIRRIDFSQIAHGRTDMKGALIRRADGAWDLGFHGAGLDLSKFYDDIIDRPEQGKVLDFVLAAEIENIWLDDRTTLRDVSVTMVNENDIWKTVLFRSVLNDAVLIQASIKPGADGNRRLTVKTGDAGKVLRAVKVYDNMVGGALSLTGTFQDAKPDRPLNGRLLIRDYRVVKAPALAHIVSIMALTGILDALQGDGLGFSVLDIPFTIQKGVVEIRDARAAGPSLGFTASGAVYTHADLVDLEGTVVPAYALNSALGRIPLLGGIFTGGEKGSGLFAANFKMTGPQEDPKVSINPLSALTPGFLRRLFGLFDGKSDDKSPEAAPKSPGNPGK